MAEHYFNGLGWSSFQVFIVRHKIKTGIILLILVYWFSLPTILFNNSTSTIIEGKDGSLLSGSIAADGQWRFPPRDSVPYKFRVAIRYFEDEYFYEHPGVNPLAIFRAFKQNFFAGRVISGGSTISMQVIRLSRKEKSRTIWEKLIEIILATRLELSYSKEEILRVYASNAPYGGNVVGLEAASWRYYGRSPEQLSWGEIATLAVLPNAPSLIFPGKNQERLLAKRNRLLDKLKAKGVFDQTTAELAMLEPLPGKPKPLPNFTRHMIQRCISDGYGGKRIKTSIDPQLQTRVNQLVKNYYIHLSQNEIYNAAVIIADVETGKIISYVGNTPSGEKGSYVDIIPAHRSTGSILKPFLYAAALTDGEILPHTILADIPTQIAGYTPQNFDRTYDGAVTASNALIRSLNIPSVRLLRTYSIERFYNKLKKLGLSTISKNPSHYGLSLILGGAEGRLDELVGIYASMSRTLNHFDDYNSRYNPNDYHPLTYLAKQQQIKKEINSQSVFSAASLWWTFNVLSDLTRPRQEDGWQDFSSSRKMAWKTGTSFGHRDAWAIGVTPEYVVGVWVGNADGEGRPGLTGLNSAAPILFDVFNLLPLTSWYQTPYDELVNAVVCRGSGMRATDICFPVDSMDIPLMALNTEACKYHQMIHLDAKKKYRVNSSCYSVSEIQYQSYFVLPPVMEWYYRYKDPSYKKLPPFAEGCEKRDNEMQVIYPKELTNILIPRELDGQKGKVVFEVAHRKTDIQLYWHIDNKYVGTTNHFHQMELDISEGKHQLIVVDQNGEIIEEEFRIIE